MHRRLSQFVLALWIIGSGVIASGGEVIDRIVAIVNGNPLLQSDVELELHFQELAAGRAVPQSFSAEQKRAALEQLIDRELIREEMEHTEMPAVPDTQIASHIEDIRKQYPGVDKAGVWNSILAAHGMSAAVLQQEIVEQVQSLRLAEIRLRPTIQVDGDSIQKYYHDQFLPQLRKSGAAEQPLSTVSARIKEILTEQKMNEQIAGWLQSLRAQADIRYTAPLQEGAAQ
jgi:peptidyl-prolyl cis-trans isomerase SurA